MSECWNWYTAWTEAPRGNYSREGSSPSSLTKRGRLAQWLERLIYIQKVVGPNPMPPTLRPFDTLRVALSRIECATSSG